MYNLTPIIKSESVKLATITLTNYFERCINKGDG